MLVFSFIYFYLVRVDDTLEQYNCLVADLYSVNVQNRCAPGETNRDTCREHRSLLILPKWRIYYGTSQSSIYYYYYIGTLEQETRSADVRFHGNTIFVDVFHIFSMTHLSTYIITNTLIVAENPSRKLVSSSDVSSSRFGV